MERTAVYFQGCVVRNSQFAVSFIAKEEVFCNNRTAIDFKNPERVFLLGDFRISVNGRCASVVDVLGRVRFGVVLVGSGVVANDQAFNNDFAAVIGGNAVELHRQTVSAKADFAVVDYDVLIAFEPPAGRYDFAAVDFHIAGVVHEKSVAAGKINFAFVDNYAAVIIGSLHVRGSVVERKRCSGRHVAVKRILSAHNDCLAGNVAHCICTVENVSGWIAEVAFPVGGICHGTACVWNPGFNACRGCVSVTGDNGFGVAHLENRRLPALRRRRTSSNRRGSCLVGKQTDKQLIARRIGNVVRAFHVNRSAGCVERSVCGGNQPVWRKIDRAACKIDRSVKVQ